MEVKLYVGNLAHSTTEEDLRLLFARAGSVASTELMQDRDSGRSKGYAFVTMSTPADAQKAIDMLNAYSLADRKLKVNAAKPRRAPGGHQGRLSAFSRAGQTPQGNASTPRQGQGGYQSQLSAFGKGSGPSGPRRRGGGGSPKK